jgi:aryl-alcohol dehydrogenase-like predicted oxidoreductase
MEAHRVAQAYRVIGPTMEQPQYNLFEREKMEKEYLDVFRTVGLGTTIWSPLASGLLSGKYNEGVPKNSRLALEGFEWLADRWLLDEKIAKVKKLSKLADEMSVSVAQLSLAWTLLNPNVSTAILGATKKEQLQQNLQALDVVEKLTPQVVQKIEKIMLNLPVPVQF